MDMCSSPIFWLCHFYHDLMTLRIGVAFGGQREDMSTPPRSAS